MRSSNTSHPKVTLVMISVLFLVALFSFVLGLKLGKTMNETKPVSQESLACAQNKQIPAQQTTESQNSPAPTQADTRPDQANITPESTQPLTTSSESAQERANQ